MLYSLLIAISAGLLFYFAYNYLTARRSYRTATKIQRWNAAIEDDREREGRGTSPDRLRLYLTRRGWNGPLLPLVIALIFIYTIVVLILGFLGIHGIIGAIASALVTWALIFSVNRHIYDKRREKFRQIGRAHV